MTTTMANSIRSVLEMGRWAIFSKIRFLPCSIAYIFGPIWTGVDALETDLQDEVGSIEN
jgi:hypothetical protein